MARTISILVGRTPRAFTQSRLEPVGFTDATTRVLTPGVPVTPTATKFGWQTTSGDGGLSPFSTVYNASVTVLGYPRAYRIFESPNAPLHFPLSGAATNGPTALDILYMYSWKPYYDPLMSGSLDGSLNSWMTSVHNAKMHVDLIMWHEADVTPNSKSIGGGKVLTSAYFKEMWLHVATQVRAFNSPYVKMCLLLGGYRSNTDLAAYLPSDSNKYLIDVYAFDPYATGQDGSKGSNSGMRTTYAGGQFVIGQMGTNFADIYLPGVPLSVGEIGWARSYGTAAQGAQWYKGAYDKCIERNLRAVAMYNHAGNALVGSYQPAFKATSDMIKSYVDASPLY